MKNDMKNVGAIDRTIRMIAGIGLPLFAWRYEGSFLLSIVTSIVGIGALLTSLTGFCFIWRLLGISTCEEKERADRQDAQNTQNKS